MTTRSVKVYYLMAEIIKTCVENFKLGKQTFAALRTNWMPDLGSS